MLASAIGEAHLEIQLTHLLLQSLRSDPSDREKRRRLVVELLSQSLDWSLFIEYARSHRCLPLVIHLLHEEFRDVVPSLLQGQLSREAATVTATNLVLTSELVRLSRELGAVGIEVVGYKGPLLSERLWSTIALRPFGDLDLLVKRVDARRAHHLLQQLGYVPTVTIATHQEVPFFRYEHDVPYSHGTTGVHIELHWRLFDRYIAFDIPDSELWEGRVDVAVAGTEVKALAAEKDLLALAVHGAKHGWNSLGWIVDIRRYFELGVIDPERLQALAKRTGTVRMLHLAIRLAYDLFALPLPPHFAASVINNRVAAELASSVISASFLRPRLASDREEDSAFYLRCRERRRDRLYYLWFWLFTPNIKDQDFLRLPEWLSPLHYLIRPLRLLGGWFRPKRVE